MPSSLEILLATQLGKTTRARKAGSAASRASIQAITLESEWYPSPDYLRELLRY
jgi:hypothetical protein